jgi:nicotinamide mononucleotide adenylyltransferase
MTVIVDQRHAARLVANRRRKERKDFRAQIRYEPITARVTVADALRDVPEWFETVEVGTVLRWIPRFGQGRGGTDRTVRDVLDEAGIQSESRRVGELTARQRSALRDLLLVAA